MPNHRRCALLAIFVSFGAGSAMGQANAVSPSGTAVRAEGAVAKLPAYDVVSVKVNKSGGGGVDIEANDNVYSARNVSLKQLLSGAYDVREDLISGLTGPVESARFDVVAKIVEPDPAAMKAMTNRERRMLLLPFLEERFKLKAHTETKALPVYELVVVAGGVKIKETAADAKHGSNTSVHGGRQAVELIASDVLMSSLAKSLAGQVHREVVDKTGLTGTYDINLKWAKEDASEEVLQTVPLLFTALQEQLGLKLQPGKGPVDTLVVDYAEMPSEN